MVGYHGKICCITIKPGNKRSINEEGVEKFEEDLSIIFIM